MTSPERERPLANIRVHPAVIILGALAIVSGASSFGLAGPSGDPPALVRNLGMGVMGVGGLILVFAYGAMARGGTTIDPRRHSSAIVTGGAYRISRNPIYVGWFLVGMGKGIESASPFVILVSLVMIGLLRWAVVPGEEEYLESAFGDEYVQYKRRVRRWL